MCEGERARLSCETGLSLCLSLSLSLSLSAGSVHAVTSATVHLHDNNDVLTPVGASFLL